MRKIVGFLFPWRKTFRRFELERRWWHRLAVVLFFIALAPMLLCSWIVVGGMEGPTPSLGGDIQYWQIVPVPPSGFIIDDQVVVPLAAPPDATSVGPGETAIPLKDVFDVVAKKVSDSDMRKTVEMPNGTTVTYPGTTADESIRAMWKHQLNVAQARMALRNGGISLLVLLIFSYLFQAAYRALLYVIFGAKAKSVP